MQACDETLPPSLQAKATATRTRLAALGPPLVALSGGVDSALLALLAGEVHGSAALALTAAGPLLAARERESARATARWLEERTGLRHRFLTFDPIAEEAIRRNDAERCYHCKRALLGRLAAEAERERLAGVVEGSNADDAALRRPGRRALREAGVASPLAEAGWTKAEIRAAARAYGCPAADAPAAACLASRLPYGTQLTAEALGAVEAVEDALARLGYPAARVRHHGAVARVELPPDRLAEAAGGARDAIVRAAKEAGFAYVALDLEGYRCGSLDETLPPETHGEPA